MGAVGGSWGQLGAVGGSWGQLGAVGGGGGGGGNLGVWGGQPEPTDVGCQSIGSEQNIEEDLSAVFSQRQRRHGRTAGRTRGSKTMTTTLERTAKPRPPL